MDFIMMFKSLNYTDEGISKAQWGSENKPTYDCPFHDRSVQNNQSLLSSWLSLPDVPPSCIRPCCYSWPMGDSAEVLAISHPLVHAIRSIFANIAVSFMRQLIKHQEKTLMGNFSESHSVLLII